MVTRRPPFFLAAALLSAFAVAAPPPVDQITKDLSGPYATKAPAPALTPHGPLRDRVATFLYKQARHQLSLLTPWKDDPTALYITDPATGVVAGAHIEHGIRPNSETAVGLATIARFVPPPVPPVLMAGGEIDPAPLPSPADCRAKALAILRFILPTHHAGGALCTDGKQWTSQWQSAHWAAQTGKAAWLLWDDLDDRRKWLAAKMIEEEADRFVDRVPDHQVVSDTKAEENAWNSDVVSLAYNMFPRHPRHAKWGETAIRWQLSAFMTSSDTKRTDAVDGKPLNQWSQFPNIYDDYTLENHDRVHPDYMTTITLNLYQRLSYEWAGNPVPQAVSFNAEPIYANLKHFALPDGGWVYPNAQDWQLHRNPDWLDAHVAMAVLYDDPQAARLARVCLTTAEKMIGRQDPPDPDKGVFAPGETHFASSQALNLDWDAHAWMLMAAHGEGPEPVAEDQLWKDLAGRYLFSFGRFGVLRTPTSISTFSWGRQTMGMAMPLRTDLLLTPNDRGLVGSLAVAGRQRETPRVDKVNVLDSKDTFAVAGVLTRGADPKDKADPGALEQRFAFVAFPDGRTVYLDTCKPLRPDKITAIDLGTLGVLNDKNWVYSDGRRTLYYNRGAAVPHGNAPVETTPNRPSTGPVSPTAAPPRFIYGAFVADTDPDLHLRSPWLNLDNLGIVLLSSAGQLYAPKPTNAPGRQEQLLHLNHPDDAAHLKPTAVVFYPNQTWRETRATAPKCRFDHHDPGQFVVTLDDQTSINVDLDTLVITIHRP